MGSREQLNAMLDQMTEQELFELLDSLQHGGGYDSFSDGLGNMYDGSTDMLGDAYGGAADMFGNAYDGAADMFGNAYDSVSDYASNLFGGGTADADAYEAMKMAAYEQDLLRKYAAGADTVVKKGFGELLKGWGKGYLRTLGGTEGAELSHFLKNVAKEEAKQLTYNPVAQGFGGAAKTWGTRGATALGLYGAGSLLSGVSDGDGTAEAYEKLREAQRAYDNAAKNKVNITY